MSEKLNPLWIVDLWTSRWEFIIVRASNSTAVEGRVLVVERLQYPLEFR